MTITPQSAYGTAKFIVSATAGQGNYTTIASAIAAASSGDDIFIRPGTYTSDLTLKPGVNLVAYKGDELTPNVIIIGKCTFTGAGTVTISNIELQTNSDYAIAVTGSAASVLNLESCYVNATNNTAINYTSSSASSAIKLFRCKTNLQTTGIANYTSTSPGTINYWYSILGNAGNSSTASSNSAGGVTFNYSDVQGIVSTTSTGGVNGFYSQFYNDQNQVIVTTAGNASQNFEYCHFRGGSSSAISIGSGTIVALVHCSIDSSNTNAITGAGTLIYGVCIFTSSSLVNVTTQTPYTLSNDAIEVVTPGSYPYTTIPQDGVILVDTSSARTIVPLASPVTGQKHIIKDNVGSASTNAITITPSGKNIDGLASRTINSNYGSMSIVYNGTEWSII